MANENNIDGLISTKNPQIQSNGLVIPKSNNDLPRPGKILTLFNANSNLLYTKYSYYSSDGSGNQQPFFVVNPNNAPIGPLKSNSILNVGKINDNRTKPQVSANEDVIRIRKFLSTSAGTRFTTTQFILQGLQSFNETKIYNPLMPILASVRPLGLGIPLRPTRFVELSLGGVLGALGLTAVSNIAFGKANPTPPPGTATGKAAGSGFFNAIVNPFSSGLPGALPINKQDGGKGLTRGRTASEAYKNLTDYWKPKNKGILGKLLDVGNFIRSNTALGALIPVGQPSGTVYKADEDAYSLMVLNGTITNKYNTPSIFGRIKDYFLGSSPSIPRFVWVDINGNEQFGVLQKWAGGSIKNESQYTYATLESDGKGLKVQRQTDQKTSFKKYKNVVVNPVVTRTKRENIQGFGYQVNVPNEQSEMLLNYDNYINNIRGTDSPGVGVYPTKLDDRNNPSVDNFMNQMGPKSNDWEELKNQKTTKMRGLSISYSTQDILNDSDYDDSIYIKRFKEDYLKKQLLEAVEGKGLTTANGDDLNKLNVLNKEQIGSVKDKDLIRFWFYDIANEKYIPFRATVKAINERYTSDWDTFQYIGNADKVYNYKGFTRSLGFTFSVVAMSIEELKPMWTRINYLLGLSKPAKYFNNQFIVPPLVSLTIGEMYLNQPIVITNMSLSIPDSATWETLTEGTSYNYYNGLKTSDSPVAQFPMEADITIDCNLLERQSPQVKNTNNFGWKDLVTT